MDQSSRMDGSLCGTLWFSQCLPKSLLMTPAIQPIYGKVHKSFPFTILMRCYIIVLKSFCVHVLYMAKQGGNNLQRIYYLRMMRPWNHINPAEKYNKEE